MAQNIQHLRLVNGEELVGDIIGETDYSILLDNPLIVEEKVDDMGSTLLLTKYIPFAKTKICELSKSHIITYNELHPELIRYYYNSLKLSKDSEKRMVDEIARVNDLMEQVFSGKDTSSTKDSFDTSYNLNVSRISKSSNTVH